MGIILVRWQYSTFQFENLKIWLAHHQQQQQQQQATAPWPWTKIGQAWRLHHKCPGLMWTSGTQWSCEAPGWILRSQVADTARLRALGQKLAVGTSKQHHKQWVHRVTLRKLHFFTLLHLHLSTTFWILLISLDRVPEIFEKGGFFMILFSLRMLADNSSGFTLPWNLCTVTAQHGRQVKSRC